MTERTDDIRKHTPQDEKQYSKQIKVRIQTWATKTNRNTMRMMIEQTHSRKAVQKDAIRENTYHTTKATLQAD